MTRNNQQYYAYGADNRFSQATSLGRVLGIYAYNGKGERTSKTVNGVKTLFVYDVQGKLLGEYGDSGQPLREHVYGPSGRLSTMSNNQIYWHHNDHLGTPQAMTDINGTKVWEMSQTPFGIATVNEDPDGNGITVSNNFRFPGQYYDAEIGLNYNYFRTFDPTLGRYTQSDPIGLRGGLNTFAYVLSNPISFIDPVGLSGIDAMIYGGISSTQAQGLSAVQQAQTSNAIWNSLSPSERNRLQAEFGSNLANQSAMASGMCALSLDFPAAVVFARGYVLGKGIQYEPEPSSFYQVLFDVSSTLLTTALPAKAAVIVTPALTSVDGVTKK